MIASKRICAIVLMVVGVPAVGTLVRAAEPATKPAAAAKVADDSPKSAARQFANAVKAGDVAAIKAVVHTSNEREATLLNAACDFAATKHKFIAAIDKKFGPERAQQIQTSIQTNMVEGFVQTIDTQLDHFTEKVNGDKAMLGDDDAEDHVSLIKLDGKWKLSTNDMMGGWGEEQYTQVLNSVQKSTEVYGQMAEEVAEGKFASFEEFVGAVRQAFSR